MIRPEYLPRYGWYLYDFANSILIINGGLYFPQWIVSLNGVSDLTYNLAFVLSSVVLILVAPALGLSADYKHAPFKYLLVSSVVVSIAGVGVGIAPLIRDRNARVVVALGCFLMILVSYQLSLVFYNALLGQVSAPRDYERVSGRALAWGWCGGIVGIFIGLPFSVGESPLGGMRAILPSAVIAGLLMGVSLFLISRTNRAALPRAIPMEEATFWIEMTSLWHNKNVWIFLVSFFLFSDAILTLQNNSTIYMQIVLNLTDTQKAYQFLLILITSAAGSLASVVLVRKLGLKRALVCLIAACTIAVVVTPAFTGFIGFSIIFGLLGLLNGGIWNISRVLFFRLIPISRRNTYFGFYSTFERFSSIVGPIAWSIPVTFIREEPLRYQVAWMGMGTFLLVSIVLLLKLENSHREEF